MGQKSSPSSTQPICLIGADAGQGNYPAVTLNYRIAARLDAFAAKAVELARAASGLRD